MVRHILQSLAVSLFFFGAIMPGFNAQLNKLPSLVEHYRHHVEDHGKTGIVEFLVMHYSEASEHRNEEDHSDLPLMQLTNSGLVLISHESQVFDFQKFSENGIIHAPEPDPSYSFLLSKGIFQPPRLG